MKFHPVAEKFPRMDAAEFDLFVADIKKNGQRHPIMLTADKRIADGINRFLACEKLKLKPRFGDLPESWTEEQIIDYIISSNIHRRHLTTVQKFELSQEMIKQLEAAAKQRQADAGGDKKSQKVKNIAPSGTGKRSTPNITSPSQTGKRSRETSRIVAKKVRISNKTVDRLKTLQKKEPELYKQVKEEKISITKAYEILRKKETPSEPSKNDIWITRLKKVAEALDVLRKDLNSCKKEEEINAEIRKLVPHCRDMLNGIEKWLPKTHSSSSKEQKHEV